MRRQDERRQDDPAARLADARFPRVARLSSIKPERPDSAGTETRRAALRLLDAVLRQGLPLESALASATAQLDRDDDRGFAHAIAAEVLRRLPDLDALIDGATQKRLPHDAKARMVLRIALVQALTLGTAPHAAISCVLPLVDGGPRKLVHGVFGAILRGGATLPERPTFPPAVAKRWRKYWGQAAVDAAGAMLAAPPPVDLSLRDAGETDRWVEALDGRSLAPGHVRIARGTAIAGLPGYAEGAWWVQDLSASLPARLLGTGDGRSALDLCAAPGGKTLQLAASGWQVTAIDLSEPRLARVHDNLARTRLTAFVEAADILTYEPQAAFDAVLLDAPCSATGIFRRHPDVLHRATDRAIARLAEQQVAMLARAAAWVKPGGVLVYATCSLERSEGEAIADRFAIGHGFAVEPVAADELPAGVWPDEGGRVRVAPGVLAEAGGMDGFFVARFRRIDAP